MRKILLLLIVPLLMISACGKDEDPKPLESIKKDTVVLFTEYGPSQYNVTYTYTLKDDGGNIVGNWSGTYDYPGGYDSDRPYVIEMKINNVPASGTYKIESTYQIENGASGSSSSTNNVISYGLNYYLYDSSLDELYRYENPNNNIILFGTDI